MSIESYHRVRREGTWHLEKKNTVKSMSTTHTRTRDNCSLVKKSRLKFSRTIFVCLSKYYIHFMLMWFIICAHTKCDGLVGVASIPRKSFVIAFASIPDLFPPIYMRRTHRSLRHSSHSYTFASRLGAQLLSRQWVFWILLIFTSLLDYSVLVNCSMFSPNAKKKNI